MERLFFIAYRLIYHVLCWLPLSAVFRLGWGIGALAYYISPTYRRLVLHNLTIAFGEKTTHAERVKIAKEHFRIVMANAFSGVRVSELNPDQVKPLVEVVNPEVMERVTSRKEGFVFVSGHRGCWEIFSQTRHLYDPKPAGFLYQKLGNEYMEKEIRESRSAFGLTPFQRGYEMQAAAHFLRAGGGVGIQVDQHSGDSGEWFPFFGRLASTSPLAGMMAARNKASVIFAVLDTVGPPGPALWTLRYQEIAAPGELSADEINTKLAQVLEEVVRQKPAEWFWVHNRWKTPTPNFLLQSYRRGMRLPPGVAPTELKPFNILVRSPNWLGDAVMALPAVRAFKNGRPDCVVTVLTPAKLAHIWHSAPYVDRVLEIPDQASVFAVGKLVKQAGYFDVAVLLPNSLRTALEARLGGVPKLYGYPGHHRDFLLEQTPAVPKEITAPPPHHAERYLDMAVQAGAISKEPAVLQGGLLLPPSAEAVPTPRATRNTPEGAEPPPRRIGMVVGAEYGPTKRWFPERFAAAANLVSAQHADCTWVLLGVPKDATIADTVMTDLQGPALDLVGQTSLTQLMQELSRCELVLTNDTGTMHLAAALGVPTVTIFGSTEPSLTGPMGTNHTILRQHVPCSPCFLRECPFNMECMQGITAQMAADAVLERLDNAPPAATA